MMDAPKGELERSDTTDAEAGGQHHAEAAGLTVYADHSHTDDAAMAVDDSDEHGATATATATAAASTALPPMETFFFSHFGEIRQGEDAESIDAAIAALDDKVGGMVYTRCTCMECRTSLQMWIIPSGLLHFANTPLLQHVKSVEMTYVHCGDHA
jgi:hypothetical protein